MLSNKELNDIFQRIVVQVQTQFATGTGFYLMEYNVVITNHHVVNGAEDVVLQSFNKEKIKADIIYLDPSMDVAFLRPQQIIEGAVHVELKSPSEMENGDSVIAIGHPHGLKFSTTKGIISKVSRFFEGIRYVQTDAAINPGNSGGPLIDEHGNIIGMNTFIISESNNLGFALHIDQIFDHLDMIKNIKESIFLCPSCSNSLILVGKFCPFCGEELPDNLPVKIEGFKHEPPEAIIEKLLAENGIDPIHARKGFNYWRFDSGSAKVSIAINQDGTIYAESLLAKLPQKLIVELYEYLLRENPKLGTDIRFGTNQKHIMMSFTMNVVSLNETHLVNTIKMLMKYADNYDDILFKKYLCEPADLELELE